MPHPLHPPYYPLRELEAGLGLWKDSGPEAMMWRVHLRPEWSLSNNRICPPPLPLRDKRPCRLLELMIAFTWRKLKPFLTLMVRNEPQTGQCCWRGIHLRSEKWSHSAFHPPALQPFSRSAMVKPSQELTKKGTLQESGPSEDRAEQSKGVWWMPLRAGRPGNWKCLVRRVF